MSDTVVAQAISFRIDDAEGDIAGVAAEFAADLDGLGQLFHDTGCSVNLCDAWLQKGRIYVPVEGEIDFEELQHYFMVTIQHEANITRSIDEPAKNPVEYAQKHIPERVESGGQAGADIGGLAGARRAGILTGGVAPKGYRTEKGPQPEALKAFGLREDDSEDYSSRTKKNVANTDATVIFALMPRSGGTVKTIRACTSAGKPFVVLNPFEDCQGDLEAFLAEHRPKVLNVAGNRESVAPGIAKRVAGIIAAACTPEPRATRERSHDVEHQLEP